MVRAYVLALPLLLGLLAVPPAREAQPARKVHRVGWLTPTDLEGTLRAFRAALQALGHDGQTVAIELRSAENDLERLPKLAAELVQSRVDVIVAVSPPRFSRRSGRRTRSRSSCRSGARRA
jgi:putative ABC transport system substrate-binding protein